MKKILLEKGLLEKLYLSEKLTPKEISIILKVSESVIYRGLIAFKIPRRNHSEAIVGKYLGRKMSEEQKQKISNTRRENKIASGKNNPMYGKPSAFKNKYHTKEAKKKISKANTGMQRPDMEGKNNINYGKCIKFFKCMYEEIGIRSGWEVKYAKYLDKHKIEWTYEPTTFELENTTYTPDFYLKDEDKYVEIKGRWFRDSKLKTKEVVERYNINLEVLQLKDLKKLGVL